MYIIALTASVSLCLYVCVCDRVNRKPHSNNITMGFPVTVQWQELLWCPDTILADRSCSFSTNHQTRPFNRHLPLSSSPCPGLQGCVCVDTKGRECNMANLWRLSQFLKTYIMRKNSQCMCQHCCCQRIPRTRTSIFCYFMTLFVQMYFYSNTVMKWM